MRGLYSLDKTFRHSPALSNVCALLLGKPLNKSQQMSAWGSNLTNDQKVYAILDAHAQIPLFAIMSRYYLTTINTTTTTSNSSTSISNNSSSALKSEFSDVLVGASQQIGKDQVLYKPCAKLLQSIQFDNKAITGFNFYLTWQKELERVLKVYNIDY